MRIKVRIKETFSIGTNCMETKAWTLGFHFYFNSLFFILTSFHLSFITNWWENGRCVCGANSTRTGSDEILWQILTPDPPEIIRSLKIDICRVVVNCAAMSGGKSPTKEKHTRLHTRNDWSAIIWARPYTKRSRQRGIRTISGWRPSGSINYANKNIILKAITELAPIMVASERRSCTTGILKHIIVATRIDHSFLSGSMILWRSIQK